MYRLIQNMTYIIDGFARDVTAIFIQEIGNFLVHSLLLWTFPLRVPFRTHLETSNDGYVRMIPEEELKNIQIVDEFKVLIF